MHSIHISTVMTIPSLKYEKTSLVFELFCQHLSFTSNLSAMAVNRQSIQLARENWGMEHPIMMFGKDLGKQHVWRKVYDIHDLCSFGCLQIWTLRFFLRKVCWDHLGVLVVWCHLWGLIFQDKRLWLSPLRLKTFIESFRGKIMYPNFFGSKVSPGLPAQFQPCWDLCSRLGDPKLKAQLGFTGSFLFSLLKDSLVS